MKPFGRVGGLASPRRVEVITAEGSPSLAFMADSIAPSEKQLSESPQAHGAFLIYRDLMPGERSASRVASEYGRHVRLIERWRSRHAWVERAAAFDAEIDRRRREAMFEEAIEMGRRQAADAAAAQTAVMASIRELNARLDGPDGRAELRDLGLAELLALVIRAIPSFATAARVEREGRGVPGASIAEQPVDAKVTIDTDRIDRAIQELIGDLGAKSDPDA